LTILEMIREAAEVVDPVFRDSPQYFDESLWRRLGVRVLCKIETANPIRSFKGRGCDYLLHRLGPSCGPLVTASAGNFGQGLAYAARSRGVRVVIYAAHAASPLKVERMRVLGADVRLAGHDLDAAKLAARDWAAAEGLRFVEDGREPEVAAGAGTIAVELLRSTDPIDAVLVPIGNGALAAGVGAWFKAHSPSTRIIGVVAERAPAMRLSWRAGHPVATPSADTIADGIAVREPVPEAVALLSGGLDDVIAVDDDLMIEAMRLAFETLGLVVEPAGAAGLAGAIALRECLAGRLVAVPLCGGNLTPEQAARWLLTREPVLDRDTARRGLASPGGSDRPPHGPFRPNER
jgi:threonine dehydratase